MLSTVEDLVRMGNAINNGTLLGPEVVSEMHRSHVDPVLQFQVDEQARELSFKQALGWDLSTDKQGRTYISKNRPLFRGNALSCYQLPRRRSGSSPPGKHRTVSDSAPRRGDCANLFTTSARLVNCE